MKVFVCETVTGGGLIDKPLPKALVPEAIWMRDSLIADLEDLPGITVVTTYDARLPPPSRGRSHAVNPGEDPWPLWAALAADCDAAWPIAPEIDGELARFVAHLAATGTRVIAPDLETIRLTSSKRATATHLAAHGIATIATYGVDDVPDELEGPIVVKPDDGAGSCETYYFARRPPGSLGRPGMIVQPYISGQPASISLLCRPDGSFGLTANVQHMRIENGAFVFGGLTVGGVPLDETLKDLATAIGKALPGLSGICGADIVFTPEGPVVVEVNPRLTTAYAGIHRALGINPLSYLPVLAGATMSATPDIPEATPVEIPVRT